MTTAESRPKFHIDNEGDIQDWYGDTITARELRVICGMPEGFLDHVSLIFHKAVTEDLHRSECAEIETARAALNCRRKAAGANSRLATCAFAASVTRNSASARRR